GDPAATNGAAPPHAAGVAAATVRGAAAVGRAGCAATARLVRDAATARGDQPRGKQRRDEARSQQPRPAARLGSLAQLVLKPLHPSLRLLASQGVDTKLRALPVQDRPQQVKVSPRYKSQSAACAP